MRFIFWNLVFLFVLEISKVYSPTPDSGNFDLARWPRENLECQSSSVSSSNPEIPTAAYLTGRPVDPTGNFSQCTLCKHQEKIPPLLVNSVKFVLHEFTEWRCELTEDSMNLWSPQLKHVKCDAKTVQSGKPDAHLACHSQCMVLKAKVSSIYNMFPDYQTTQYLHEKCGMATEGKCSTVTPIPVCWCYSHSNSKDQRRNTLSNCRSGIQLTDKFTTVVSNIFAKHSMKSIQSPKKEAVHMQNLPHSRPPTGHRIPRERRLNTNLMASCCGMRNRPDSPDDSAPILLPGQSSAHTSKKQKTRASTSSSSSSSQRSEADYLPEAEMLFTTVRVSGRPALAMVDTGAAICLIHPNLAVNTVYDQTQLYGFGVDDKFQVLGKSTIRLGVGTGVTVPLTGYVADRGYELVLGNDFFVAWAAKIRISDRAMDLSTGLSQVRMNIQFLRAPANVGMMNLHQEGYTSLTIAAKLNEIDTRVVIDTGSCMTIVDRNFVRQPIRRTTARCLFGGTTSEGFVGTTKVTLVIGSFILWVPAFVPTFQPDDNLLAGCDFIRQYIELIDYESKSVTLKLPSPAGASLFETRAFVIDGE